MSLLEFVILFIVAGICGSIAQTLAGYSHGGCLTAVAVGFIGALLGAWIARAAGIPDILAIQIDDHTFPLVWSIIGGALFAAVLSLIARARPAE